MDIKNDHYYELVVMPVGLNIMGCAIYDCDTQAGFPKYNFETVNFIAYVDPIALTVAGQQVQRMYEA